MTLRSYKNCAKEWGRASHFGQDQCTHILGLLLRQVYLIQVQLYLGLVMDYSYEGKLMVRESCITPHTCTERIKITPKGSGWTWMHHDVVTASSGVGYSCGLSVIVSSNIIIAICTEYSTLNSEWIDFITYPYSVHRENKVQVREERKRRSALEYTR